MHDIQLISECRRSISLEIGRVLLSPQEYPIDILLSLLGALDVGGEEAEALRFWEWVSIVCNFVHRVFRAATIDPVTTHKSGRGLGIACVIQDVV